MNKFEVSNMDLYYGSFHALKNININIPEREITAFIGPSGCGKSTFLKSLNRMNDLVEGCRISGDINLDGQVDITDVILLNRYCSGTVSLNKNAVKNADCDGDKEVSSNDAVVLLQFLVHIVSFLPHSA